MITLDAQNRSLEIVLSAPVVINEFPIILAFSTISSGVEKFRSQISQTNSTTPVTVLQAPKTQTQISVKQLTLQNKDSSNNTVNIHFNNNGVLKEIVSVILQPLDTLFYEDGNGFAVIDSNGRTTLNATGAVGNPAVGSISPGGSNTQLQFNDSGLLGGDANLSWNKSTSILTVLGNVVVGNATVVVSGNSISIGNSTVNASINSTAFVLNAIAIVLTNDSRLSDSRIPTGSAGGLLTGTYPNPTANTSYNLTVNAISIGTSVVNSTIIAEGANVVLSTTQILVGNASQNATINSTGFAVNGTLIVVPIVPLDITTQAYLYDDFFYLDNQRWTGGSLLPGSEDLGHPGEIRIISTVLDGLFITNQASRLLVNSNFDITWIVSPRELDHSTYRVGWSDARVDDPPTHGMYFERLNSDTDWFAVTRASNSQTRHDMNVSAVLSTWYRLRIRRKDASTVSFSINGGTEFDQTLTIPTVNLDYWCQCVSNNNSFNAQLYIDTILAKTTGLSR